MQVIHLCKFGEVLGIVGMRQLSGRCVLGSFGALRGWEVHSMTSKSFHPVHQCIQVDDASPGPRSLSYRSRYLSKCVSSLRENSHDEGQSTFNARYMASGFSCDVGALTPASLLCALARNRTMHAKGHIVFLAHEAWSSSFITVQAIVRG